MATRHDELVKEVENALNALSRLEAEWLDNPNGNTAEKFVTAYQGLAKHHWLQRLITLVKAADELADAVQKVEDIDNHPEKWGDLEDAKAMLDMYQAADEYKQSDGTE